MTRVSVIIPAYNAGPAFGAALVWFADYFAPYRMVYEMHYIVVDDGSTDATAGQARAFAKFRANVTVAAHDRRRGLGHALRTGFGLAGGEYTVVMDGNLQYTPSAALEMLEALESTGADVVAASPYMAGGHSALSRSLRASLERIANHLLSLRFKGRCRIFTCILRAYRTQFLKRLAFASGGVQALPELMYAAIASGGHIVELPARRHWHSLRERAFAAEFSRGTS